MSSYWSESEKLLLSDLSISLLCFLGNLKILQVRVGWVMVFSLLGQAQGKHIFALMECAHLCFPGWKKALLLKTPEILGCYYPDPPHLLVLNFGMQHRLMAREKQLR